MAASIPYRVYEWLKKQRGEYEIVHGAEWGVNQFYCLQAKHLGLHFSKSTLL